MVLGAILSSHKKLQANQTEQFLLETEMGESHPFRMGTKANIDSIR